jgi:hypothetical protein
LLTNVSGGPFVVDRISNEDLKNGNWTASWLPTFEHGAVPPERAIELTKMALIGMQLAFGEGAFDTGDEWNRLLPNYKFTDAGSFLRKAWDGKP